MSKKIPKKEKIVQKNSSPNTPLWVLLIGALLIFVLIIFSDSGFTNNLSNLLGLENQSQSSQKTVKKTAKTDDKIEEVQVKRALDGDTIELKDGRKIRYLNVDTPETVKSGTSVKCFGPEASKFNKELMTENRTIWLTSDKAKTDRYARDLRFVFLKESDTGNIGLSVNANLVKLGFGQAKSYSPNTTYKKDFEKWQFEAQQKNIGIWKSCAKPFDE